MTRVGVYARYSSEHQSERSIDDQVRLCRSYLERQGWTEAAVYADYAISGAHLLSRPQALRMLEAVKAGEIDIVLAEALDRLSRDQEHIAALYKRIGFAGARIVTVGEGEISELHVGLKGTMNALFLADLAKKIRRGQMGRAVAGYIPGGRAYGYDVVRGELDARGEPVKGLRAVNPDEAEIVRRIYAEYAAGAPARTIAHGLNLDAVPAPAGGNWRASTISGNRERGSGILWNEAYRGALVYNRVRMIKDPDTGRRVSRPNPRDEWVVMEMPGLRIIDEPLWQAVQRQKGRFDHKTGPIQRNQKHLLSGLLRCGVCGGTYQIRYQGRSACSTNREQGDAACSNTRTVVMADAVSRVLATVQRDLKSPDTLAAIVREYDATRKRLAKEQAKTEGRTRARLQDVEREIDNAVATLTRIGFSDAMAGRLKALEAERNELNSKLVQPDDNVVSLHPKMLAEYQRAVDQLVTALRSDPADMAASRQVLQRVFERIEVHPLPGRGQYDLRARTRIETLTTLSGGSSNVQFVGSGGGT
ncbi:recombinase family protein [Thalassobaculum litoreum]|uniref:Site-specific DNA recombinase n=1 Tax=Thalassobaculum litoreum DSM 18839 TaxID=1123362 RepID=A0A8G2BI32_9PROT|nr:recombinase family protein [Thalassobaculum litoreum]SDF82485.1 Site-specific DNA recombinase [Thalassobaculum litoreum DSM 18839]